MMRWLAVAWALIALGFGARAEAGSWDASRAAPGGYAIFSWTTGESGDQPAIDISACGLFGWSSEFATTGDVDLFVVPTPTTATSGTPTADITATQRTTTGVRAAPLWLRPSITSAGTDGSIAIRCAAFARGQGAGSSGGGGGGGSPPATGCVVNSSLVNDCEVNG